MWPNPLETAELVIFFLQRRKSNRWLERNNGNRKEPVRKSLVIEKNAMAMKTKWKKNIYLENCKSNNNKSLFTINTTWKTTALLRISISGLSLDTSSRNISKHV